MNQNTMRANTVLLTVTSIASQLLAFVYRIFLSRLVGSEVLGLYQLIMPVYAMLMSLTAIGLTAAASNLSAQYYALGNLKAIRQLIRRCLFFFLLMIAPVALTVLLCSDAISVYLLGDARTRLGLVLLLPCITLTGIENLHKHYFYGTGNVGPPALVEIAEQLIRSAAVLTLLVLFLPQSPEKTVGLIVVGMVLCEVFSSVTLMILFRRRMGPPHALAGSGEAPRQLSRRIGAISLPVGATSLLGNLMGSANSVLIPQRLVAGGMEVSRAMSSFGILFGMTLPMLLLPSTFIGALNLVLMPRLAENAALKRQGEIRRLIAKAMLVTSVLMLPAMALVVVLGPAAAQLMFREPAAGTGLLPLAVGVALSCYQVVLGCALNGVGRQRAAARNSLISGAVQLVITYYTVGQPQWGLQGYVAGFVLSSALGMALNWLGIARETGLRLGVFPCFLAPALAALLTGLCCNLLYAVLLQGGLSMLASGGICLALGGVLYLAALQAQGVPFFSLFRSVRGAGGRVLFP